MCGIFLFCENGTISGESRQVVIFMLMWSSSSHSLLPDRQPRYIIFLDIAYKHAVYVQFGTFVCFDDLVLFFSFHPIRCSCVHDDNDCWWCMGVQTMRECFYTVSFLVLGKIYGDVEKVKNGFLQKEHIKEGPRKRKLLFFHNIFKRCNNISYVNTQNVNIFSTYFCWEHIKHPLLAYFKQSGLYLINGYDYENIEDFIWGT